MKVAYKHLISLIPSKPSIDEISEKFFQLGHEHEVEDEIFDMELTPNRGDCLSVHGLVRDLAPFYEIDLINMRNHRFQRQQREAFELKNDKN